jgi:uncharacterized protein YukE
MMGAIADAMALADQDKLDKQAAVVRVVSEHEYNTDGSAKAKDYLFRELPPSKWPSHLSAGGRFSVHPDALTGVAKQMGADLAELQSTLNKLKGRGAGGATLGGWATADGIGNNAGQAYYGIFTFYTVFNDVYDQVIGYLHQTVANYAIAENTATIAANNVGTDIAPGMLSGSSVAWTAARPFRGGAKWRAITSDTYHIKTMEVMPSSASGMTASEIENLFSELDPSAVAEAGDTHTAAAHTLHSIADALVTHAQALAGGWSGTSAQASIAAFRQLHMTVVPLATASAQTGQVLTWLGGTILPDYKNWKAPSDGLKGVHLQDQAAQQVMQRLNDWLVQANGGLPASVAISLPKIGQTGQVSAITDGSGRGGGAAAAAAGARLLSDVRSTSPVGSGGGLGGGVGVSDRGARLGGGLGVVPTDRGGQAAPLSHLAGLPPGGGTPPGAGSVTGGTGGVPGGGGLPGGTAPGGGTPVGPVPIGPVPGEGTPPGAGGMPGPGSEPPGEVGIFPEGPGGYGEPGAGVGGTASAGTGPVGEDAEFLPGDSAVMGSDGMIGTGPGMAEGESVPGNTGVTGFIGANNAATQSGGEFPMTGGSGGGRRENDRYRDAWMAEDVDTWEGETAQTSLR